MCAYYTPITSFPQVNEFMPLKININLKAFQYLKLRSEQVLTQNQCINVQVSCDSMWNRMTLLQHKRVSSETLRTTKEKQTHTCQTVMQHCCKNCRLSHQTEPLTVNNK